MCYTVRMKNMHRDNSDVRQHYTIHKNSAESFRAKLLYAGELKNSLNWTEQKHSHTFLEIVFVKSGTGTLFTSDGQFPVHTGDVLVYNPGIEHSESAAKGEELALYFCGIDCLNIKDLPKNSILAPGACPVIDTGDLRGEFEQYFCLLIRETQNKPDYYDEISASLVKIIVNLILRLLARSDRDYFKTNDSYLSARKYIDEHFDQLGCIEDVCKTMFISRYYLSHLFKEYSGISPIRYIISKRIEKAKTLLAGSSLSVQEIALRSGYGEVGSFIKIFKKFVNLTPGEYRKKYRA